jgi:hypothetical protein
MSVLMAGGRGPGKTTGAIMAVLRHCEMYRERARVLITRETLKSLIELADNLQAALTTAYPRGLRVNRQDNTFRLGNGAVIECAPLADPTDYSKIQGRSFSLIVVEELGNFRTMKWVTMLRSNLRAGDLATRIIATANPGGPLHQQIHQQYISKAVPWLPFMVDGRPWVWCPGTLHDNPHLPAAYKADLLAACAKDSALAEAWINGNWSIARGAFFADVIDESRQKFSHPGIILPDSGVHTFVSCDWGISAPSVAYAAAHIVGGDTIYPRGSLILLDEVHSAAHDDYSVGLQWSPGRLADGINAMCERNNVAKEGCIDDARGLNADETLIKLMREHGLWFQRPAKGRAEGWSKMRDLLFNSKESNGRPGLWVSERCRGFWETVPTCPRDAMRPEDLDSAAVDHFADSARYACTFTPQIVTFGTYIV